MPAVTRSSMKWMGQHKSLKENRVSSTKVKSSYFPDMYDKVCNFYLVEDQASSTLRGYFGSHILQHQWVSVSVIVCAYAMTTSLLCRHSRPPLGSSTEHYSICCKAPPHLRASARTAQHHPLYLPLFLSISLHSCLLSNMQQSVVPASPVDLAGVTLSKPDGGSRGGGVGLFVLSPALTFHSSLFALGRDMFSASKHNPLFSPSTITD